jgi:HSP20 family protein
MSKLVPFQKNGSLANTTLDFPTWSHWIDNFFNSEIPHVLSNNFNEGISIPKVNIKDTPDAFVLDLAAPGMKKTDFKIELEQQLLSVSSELTEDHMGNGESYTRREFSPSSFKRSFTLPDTADDQNIHASYTDGILTITIPKKEEAKKKPARTIKIS